MQAIINAKELIFFSESIAIISPFSIFIILKIDINLFDCKSKKLKSYFFHRRNQWQFYCDFSLLFF